MIDPNALISPLATPAIIVALVEVVKRALAFNDSQKERFLPLLNIAVGILFGVVFYSFELKFNVLLGALAGLSAGGLYDLRTVGKAIVEKIVPPVQ